MVQYVSLRTADRTQCHKTTRQYEDSWPHLYRPLPLGNKSI